MEPRTDHRRPRAVVWMALLAAGAAVASLSSCGSPCPFGLLSQRTYSGQVQCCGAAVRQDFQVPADVEIDVLNLAPGGPTGRVDFFLTRSDCDRVFDGEYPPPAGTAPRCTVIAGPVAPGSTSARQRVSTGTYRLHAQAWTSNTSVAVFAADVALWGENCSGVVF